jgi:uncharacterized protein YndB with AHSA1/START domain
MTDAALLTDRPRPAVRLERHLAEPPAVVWRALTEREQLRSWFPCRPVPRAGTMERSPLSADQKPCLCPC